MTDTPPPLPELPPLPMRQIATCLPFSWVDEIDLIRRDEPDVPSRSEVLRESVGLFLRLMRLPVELRFVVMQALIAMEEEIVSEEIGEPVGTA